MTEKHQKRIFWAIVATETSHIFCCVLPTLFSLASVLAGLGINVTMPGWLESAHDVMHGYELPVIMFSAGVVALGWGLHYYSLRNDCHDVGGCHHEPCGPKKRRASKILIAASILLAINFTVYFGIHRPMDQASHHAGHEHYEHDHGHEEEHGGHDDH